MSFAVRLTAALRCNFGREMISMNTSCDLSLPETGGRMLVALNNLLLYQHIPYSSDICSRCPGLDITALSAAYKDVFGVQRTPMQNDDATKESYCAPTRGLESVDNIWKPHQLFQPSRSAHSCCLDPRPKCARFDPTRKSLSAEERCHRKDLTKGGPTSSFYCCRRRPQARVVRGEEEDILSSLYFRDE